jgi:hypothetical protein
MGGPPLLGYTMDAGTAGGNVDMDRRDILKGMGLTAATAVSAAPASAQSSGQVRHQVFFWLVRPGHAGDRARLVSGLKALAAIPQIRELHVGVPAATEQRDVVDASFDVSELMVFDTLADQKTYQDHPAHQAFVAACAPLWRKVVVYDSVPA